MNDYTEWLVITDKNGYSAIIIETKRLLKMRFKVIINSNKSRKQVVYSLVGHSIFNICVHDWHER